MAIKHTMVSYYGLNYVEHAEADFREMLDHGVDTVLLAITEFDMDFWFPNINAIVKKAHEMGLRVIADTWGIGKFFGGEQVSLFLQNNIHHRRSAERCLLQHQFLPGLLRAPVPEACPGDGGGRLLLG